MAAPQTFTPAQLVMLQTLAAQGSLPRRALMSAAGVGHNTAARVIESLVYRRLVTEGARPKGRSTYLIDITPAGRSAMAALAAGTYTDADRVPSPNRLAVSIPILPQVPYYRNNGHRNIQSRGVAC